MKTKGFIGLMIIVAIVAVMYSPSTINLTSGGFSTSPTSSGDNSTSMFLKYLREEGYNVILLNSSGQLNTVKQGVYMLIGPDTAVSSEDVQYIKSLFDKGTLSMLIAEGNATNNNLLEEIFGASVSGASVVVPSSYFLDKRVFIVSFSLEGKTYSGVLDIASYLSSLGKMTVLASTPPDSYDTSSSIRGPRSVIALYESNYSKAMIVTDSGPFTNKLLDLTNINERNFTFGLVTWVSGGRTNETIYLDNYHYTITQPKYVFGLPIGPLFDYALSIAISNLNNYYQQLPSSIQSYLHLSYFDASIIAGLLVLFTAYGLIRRTIQKEKPTNDDAELPEFESKMVSISESRLEFNELVKKKSFYVATCERLYEIVNDIVAKEYGEQLEKLAEDADNPIIKNDIQSRKFVIEITRIHYYATGKKRILIPPVINWKKKVVQLNRMAEDFLSKMNLKIANI